MDKLKSELTRLYLPLDGQAEGEVRAIALPFRPAAGGAARHWDDLCKVANVLQEDYGFPAPAVSVASSGGYVLWLSLATPVPVAAAREFVALLGQAHPDVKMPADAVGASVELPPCLDAATGKWSAFIHPGMGASFADESGLDMQPPTAGQLGFLDGLRSIGADQFREALAGLRQAQAPTPPTATAPARPAAQATSGVPDTLLLKDATLEDIVRFLHAKNIEPTFRHLIPPV